MSTPTKFMPVLNKSIKVLIILFLIGSFYAQNNMGLADNGDFVRSSPWISSGPVGIEPNWPALNTEAWRRRFFLYWIPTWKLDFPGQGLMKSSALLLWAPGVLWNYSMVSRDVLYSSNLSIAPKFLLIGLMLLLFLWIEKSKPGKILKTCLLITLCLPVFLMFSTTDYVAYFNSFYFETASFVFIFAFLASLIFLKRQGNSAWSYAVCGTSLMLLTTAKTSNIYWPLIALPWILGLQNFRSKPWRYVPLYILLTVVLTAMGYFVAGPPPEYNRINTHNRFFSGILMFSAEPYRRLAELNVSGAEPCVGHAVYDSVGRDCQAKYEDRISITASLLVLLREPPILFKMIGHAARNMQIISIDYLGKLAPGSPRQTHHIPLNSWSNIKSGFFPKGYALWLVLVFFLIIFIWNIRSSGLMYELALIGVLTTIALVVDMQVAILGDGQYELVKHLFLSNVLFDVASIAALNILVLQLVTKARNRFRKQSKGEMTGLHP